MNKPTNYVSKYLTNNFFDKALNDEIVNYQSLYNSCVDDIEGRIDELNDEISKFVPPRGQQGDQGTQGTKGKKGAPGDKGPRGIQGDKGQQGQIGPDGPDGDEGDEGKSGDFIYSYDQTIYTEPDGSHWIRIVRQNNPASSLFLSTDSYTSRVFKNSNTWFYAYEEIRNFRVYSNKYEFMVKQKQTSSSTELKFRWIQNVNPIVATYEDTIASKITKITTSGYTNYPSAGGLYRFTNSHTGANSHFVINNGYAGNWFGSFGVWKHFNDGIPAYPGSSPNIVTTGYLDLYIRILIAEQGDQGPTGPNGDKGDKGYIGDKGHKGNQGPIGYQGLQGAMGIQGSLGQQGSKGPTGTKGKQGTQGIQGAQGLTGEIGSVGLRGFQGLVGLPGEKGIDTNPFYISLDKDGFGGYFYVLFNEMYPDNTNRWNNFYSWAQNIIYEQNMINIINTNNHLSRIIRSWCKFASANNIDSQQYYWHKSGTGTLSDPYLYDKNC